MSPIRREDRIASSLGQVLNEEVRCVFFFVFLVFFGGERFYFSLYPWKPSAIIVSKTPTS